MNRRSSLIVLLLFLLPLTVPLIPAGPVTTPSEAEATTVIPLLTETPSLAQAAPALPEGPTKVAGQYEYDGLGAVRSTQEYALGTNTSLAVTSLNYSAQNVAGGMRLPAGWTGYRMQANISNLYDQLYWVSGSRENGNFASGGSTATNWTRVNSGTMGTNGTWPLDGYGCNYGLYGWGGVSIGYSGSRGVQAWVEFEDTWSWDTGKYVAWENTVAIPRDSPTYARLTFRYQADSLAGSTNARGRMVVYVYVAGQTYSQIIAEDEAWHQVTVSIPDDHLTAWPQHGSILVRLGFSFTSTQSAWDYECWGFNFDDVTLEVRGKAQPQHTWLQLWMNSTAVSNGASYGLGTVTASGTWANPGTTPLRVVARWYTQSSSSVKVDFTYNLTLYIRRTSTTEQQMPPDGSSFWVRNTSSVYWSAWFYAYQPYYFQRYNLTIQRPTETWTLVKATDPQFVDRTSLVQSNSTYFLLPYTSFYDYGWWNFNFTSTNRVSSLTLNSKSFQIAPNTPNTLTVTATLGLSTGVANLTLYNATGSVVKEEKKTVSSTSVSFTNIVFNTDNGTWFRPGVYTLCVSYANGLTGAMTAVGFKSALITVKHGSTSVVPELQTYQVTRIAGTYFYPRVRYYDNDTAPDSTITGATVVGNWTGTNTFDPAGTWYEARLAADAKTAGNYTLRVNATLTNYGDAYYNIKVVVLEQTALSSPDSPGMTQPYNKQVAARFRFIKVYDSTPITGATVTSNWTGATNPTSQSNGWYNFTIDTAQVAKPGTYYMKVTASKLNHQQQTLTLTIVVRERDSLMVATASTTVPINGKSLLNVTLSDNDGAGAAITNSTNKLHLQVWRLGQRYWSVTVVQLVAGKYNVSIDTTPLGAEGTYAFVVNFTWYGSPNNQPFYGNRTATVYVSVRKIVTKLDYTPPDQQPWGNSMNVTVSFLVDDPASSEHGSAPAVSTIACTLNGSALTRYTHYDWISLGGGNYKITIYASRILDVALWQLQVQVTPTNTAKYTSASRSLAFRTRAHQTQVVADPPAKTAFGFNTPMTVRWLDLDKASASVPGNLSSVVVSNCPVGGNQGFGSLSFTLTTTSWSVGIYTLTVTVTPSLKWYQGGIAQVNLEIRIHYTSVVVQPPVATAWGYNTSLVIQWTDLDTGGAISTSNLKNVTVTGCPVGGNQVFTGTLTPTLVTRTWSISAGYLLTVNVYAVTTPSRSYNDVSGTVTVIIRMHRVNVVVPTPAPTRWAANTNVTVTWTDLDKGSNIPVGNLSKIVVMNGPGGNQTFTTSLSFTLVTSSWNVGSYLLTVIVYPITSPQRYDVGSAQITLTIRAHYVSVTVDPPTAKPWGNNTPLVVHWLDADTGANIAVGNLSKLVVMNGPGGNQTFFATLNPTLATSTWSVNIYLLQVWVYGNTKYYNSSGPVSVTIRGHQTQTGVLPPQQTPFGFNTPITVSWIDLEKGGATVPGNLSSIVVSNCPVGGPQTFFSLSFTLVTSSWSVGIYQLTVTTTPSTTWYLGSSSSFTLVIRIHYSSVVVEAPAPTPWGFNTPLVIRWTDLDTGATIGTGSLKNVTITNCPVGGNQVFTGTLTPTLSTSTWTMSAGYLLTAKVYAVTTPTRQYSDASGNFTVVIRNHRVYVIPLGPAPVPQQGSIPFSITWTDLETGAAVNPSYLLDVVVTRISGPATPTLPATYTQLTFSHFANGWVPGDYSLNVTVRANSALYQTGSGTVTVTIRVHVVTCNIDPISRVPYSNNFTFTLRVNDSDLVPSQGLPENHITSIRIRGGPTSITYTQVNWTGNVQNGTANDGIWVVRIDSRTWAVGSYSLTIDVVTSTSYADGVVYTQVQVRALATSFTYQSPPVVAWGEYGRLTVSFIVSDPTAIQDGTPIAGGVITIAGYSSPTHFTYVGYANGTYVITFSNSTVLTAVGNYLFDITITKGVQYASGFLNDVPLTVRPLFTWLHPTSVPQTPYGDNIVILVAFQVLDGASYRNLYNISTANILVNSSTWVKGTQYIVTWLSAQKLYNITIYASAVPQIRWYSIRIDALNPGHPEYNDYTISKLDFQVRTVATALALSAPDQQPWGNNFTITVTYIINDPDSRRNGQGIAGYARNITLTGYSRPSQYTVQDLGLGNYQIVLNASLGKTPGTYTVTLNIVWTQSPPPYAAQTKPFQITLTQRPTDTLNQPGVEFGYADFIVANFTYVDLARSSARILNTSYGVGNVLVKVYWKHPVHTGGSFWLLSDQLWNTTSMTGQPYAFKLTIKADFAGYVDTYYDFNVSITWKAGTAPYFSGGAFSFRAYVVGQRTNLTLQPTQGATPYGQIMNFTVVYLTQQGNAITNQTPNSYVHFRMLCPKVPGLSYGTGWWVNYIGAGSYTIHVRTTALAGIDTYLFYLNVTYDNLPNPTPSPYYQSQYNMPIIQGVRAIDTLLNYQSPGTVYYGENVRFLAEYWDKDNGIHVPGSPTVKAYWDNGTEIIGAVIFQYPSGPYQDWYNITIPTAGVLAGRYVSFEIRASNTYYVSKVQSLQIYINLLPLNMQLLTDPVVDKFYGEQPYPVVKVTVQDKYGWVTAATVTGFADWGSPFAFDSFGNGTYYKEIKTEHDRDRYPIEIRASRTGQYANASVYVTLTITAGPSLLNPVGSTTYLLVYAGDHYTIRVNYTTAAGVPLTGASVSYTCADEAIGFGDLTEGPPGIYEKTFDSAAQGLLPVIYTIALKATLGGNVQSQSLAFAIDVRLTLVDMVPQDAAYVIPAQYLENFTIRMLAYNMKDPGNPVLQSGLPIQATWQGLAGTVYLTDLGNGSYVFAFPANLAAPFSYPLHLDLISSLFAGRRTTLTIQIIERSTSPVIIVSAFAVYGAWNQTLDKGNVFLPVGDWLYVYFYYADANSILVEEGAGSATIDGNYIPGLVNFDNDTKLYLLKLLIDAALGLGTHSLSVLLSKTNFLPQSFATAFSVIRIPTELSVVEVVGQGVFRDGTTYTIYIGTPFEIRVFLNDTWHNRGVDNATLALPAGWTAPTNVTWKELGNGSYVIYGLRTALGEVTLPLSVTATRTYYQDAPMAETLTLEFRYSPQFILMTWGGTAAVIILVVLLLSWLLWVRVFSIPWEVRRLRTLAKKVGRDQTFDLSGKDRKRFRAREVNVEDTVGKAMTTIGVPVTAAMLPTTTEVAEVSATEEDLMGELDKIPGLGAEEKAVLAQEMRKIPRKDRIWFLDDLRRQMGERRMDFLTTKTPTPAPAPTVRAEAAAKLALVEAPKPLTPTKPGKPKEKVEKAAKPEKPKERVAPTVRPREEHVAPPPTDAVEVEIRRELDKIPGLSADEKSALLEHLKYLTPEERRATYQSLRQTADK